MQEFLEFFFLGISNGSIYASLALAIVILMKTIKQPNIAQGEMATFSTIIASFLIGFGLPYWVAFFSTLAISFALGCMIEFVFFRPVERHPPTSQLMVLVGLFLIINGVSGFLLGYDPTAFPAPFDTQQSPFDNKHLNYNEIFSLALIIIMMIGLTLFYKHTKVGLALRALAESHTHSELMGINVSYMLLLNWGLSATIGATSGMLVAPVLFLEPNMMLSVLIFALAGAVLGGLSNPFGAVVGGILVGLINAIIINYLDIVNQELETFSTLLIVVFILLIKPEGLFGQKTVRRV